ncbi:response regulator [Janthinobacterium sp. 78]|uniref:response regulator n=1 Tax=Janthinobacterium sp. 78 TaxID=2135631 RepID=UPI000D5F6437|nr:response regulator [Janthinobacterium sp. 78]PVX36281.1 response regulator receiver domain-containing protein [Janthinobacterium sp. 78]
MKILITDDDPKRRQSIFDHFIEKGISIASDIYQADCTDQAKNLLENFIFDVLILDIVLPKRSNENPQYHHGLALLGQITRSNHLNKPDRIIGITAHLEDIKSYQDEFSKFCLIVIEANKSSIGWKTKVSNALTYVSESKTTRHIKSVSLNAITVHGIRTFGSWQNRLKILTHSNLCVIPFHNYSYGYFSAFSFLIPMLRMREIDKLERHFLNLFQTNKNCEFIIFCHSFGTYLVANSLRRIIKENKIPIKTIVMCGSVLKRDFDWKIFRDNEIKIINDCADKDYVLWLSEGLILGTGMAGKTGFHGFQDSFFTNRFFNGGHSSYFSDHFMKKYWLPLFFTSQEVACSQERESSVIKHEILEKVVLLFGKIKPLIYMAAVILLVIYLSLWSSIF